MSSKTPPDSSQYRDARPGAEARRRELLARRRAELAAQPLELRRIFARRAARSAAGAVALAGGLVLALAARSAAVRDALESFFPGHHPAVVSNLLLLTAVAAALAYFVVRAVAEDRFTTRMIRTVRPSADVFADLDRLEVTPTRVALSLADRLRAPSFALLAAGVAGLAAPAALAGYALLELGAWDRPTVFEELSWTLGVPLLQTAVLSAIAGGLGLAVLERRGRPDVSRREPHGRDTLGRVCGTTGVVVAAVLGATCAASNWPGAGIWLTWMAGTGAGLATARALLRREDRATALAANESS